MKKTVYQIPELRDENDNIIQAGTYGKESPLVNSTNDGVLDYINNNLEALHDAQTAAGNAITTGTLTVSGKTTTGTLEASSATVSGQTTTGTLAAGDTTVTGSITTTGLTVTGATSVPTANEGDSSKTIANTEFVTAKAGNYLPLSGGRMTGELTTTGSTYIPINIKTTGTDYRDIQIESSDGNHRIATIRASKTSEGRCEITIGVSTTSNAAPTGITISRSTTNIYAIAPTPDATDNSQKIATTGFVRTIVPAGVVLAYARGAVPTGWLLCDGSAVSRTTYAALFAVIGTTYGTGDGSTTFNLPNLVDKFIQGSATAGTVKSAGLPNITGEFRAYSYLTGNGNGAFNSSVNTSNVLKGARDQDLNWNLYTFDASRSSAIYGKSDTVQPPALTMRYIIKY